jgi:hypothetical protein
MTPASRGVEGVGQECLQQAGEWKECVRNVLASTGVEGAEQECLQAGEW